MFQIYVFLWKKRNLTERTMLIIILSLLLIVIGFLIKRLCCEGGGNSSSGQQNIHQLQDNYSRFRFTYVSIIRPKGRAGEITCLGVAINRVNVITLATCMLNSNHSDYEIVLGKHFLGRNFTYEKYYNIKKVEFHPKYEKTKEDKYNLAIIFLDDTIQFNKYICQAHLSERYQYSGKAVVHGWDTADYDPETDDILPMDTTTFIMNKDFCGGKDDPICQGELNPKFDEYCVGQLGSPIIIETQAQKIVLGLALVKGFPCYNDTIEPKMLRVNQKGSFLYL